MHGLERYLLKQLGLSVCFVALVVTLAIWLTQSLQYVDYIVNRGLTLGTFFYFTMLLMPSLLAIILPVALFISVMFIYHRLTLDRELIVMRATGMSQISLAVPALVLALLVTAVGYGFNLYVLPVTFRQFKDLQSIFRDDLAGIILQDGRFNTLSDGLTVYIRHRDPDGVLHGILAHDNRDPEKPVTYMAERGALVSTPQGPRVILVNGNRQEVDTESGRLTMLYFDRNTVDLNLFRQSEERSWREPSERFVHELLWPTDSDADRFHADQLRAAGHQRLATPLLSLSFTLIALAGLLSGEFNRQGQARRVIVAVVSVLALQAGSFGLYSIVSREPALTASLYLIAVLPAIAAGWILVRDPRRRPLPAELADFGVAEA